jgi:hypothetical protein
MATRVTKAELEAEVQHQEERIRELEFLLAAKNNPGIHFKVSTRGAISIYGLQRFPITLYKNQWERLLNQQAQLVAFIRLNEAKLSVKSN